MIRPVFLLTSFFLLSGCATTDWAAINKQVSDTAANLTKTLGGNDSGESGGMPLMSPAGQQAMQSVDKTFSVPVDVDTAAARLKRHYKFISTQELEALRQAANDGDWKAAAEDDAHPVWDAMPGSYYKMGSDWNGRDHRYRNREKRVRQQALCCLSLIIITASGRVRRHEADE